MRELDLMEINAVDGGAGALIPLIVAGSVLGAAAIAVVGYAAYKGCSASAEVSKDGVKVEVDCKVKQ